MQSKKPRTTRGKPKRTRARKPKPGAVKGERLKPISLYGMELDDALKRLVSKATRPPAR
jgi:hypothetical protein